MQKDSLARPDLSQQDIREINARFKQEVDRYSLAWRCQQCVHVLQRDHSCTLSYPNAFLAKGEVRALDENGGFVFCKDFELED